MDEEEIRKKLEDIEKQTKEIIESLDLILGAIIKLYRKIIVDEMDNE